MSNNTQPSVRKAINEWVVVIIDDQPDNLEIAKAALEFQGAEVHAVASGELGLALLDTVKPTFILLDLSMPKMDGWETRRRIRERPETAQTPVIALTAHAMDGDRERVLSAGFDGYIPKPFDIMMLAKQIQQIITHISTIPTPPQD